MTSLITVALQLIFAVVTLLMDRAKVSNEIKKSFYEWVKLAGSDMKAARLIEWGDKQLLYLKENVWQETK